MLEKMQAIVDQYVKLYKNDFDADREWMKSHGDEYSGKFIWIVRENGTNLIPEYSRKTLQNNLLQRYLFGYSRPRKIAADLAETIPNCYHDAEAWYYCNSHNLKRIDRETAYQLAKEFAR